MKSVEKIGDKNNRCLISDERSSKKGECNEKCVDEFSCDQRVAFWG
jgi:hypothetical protein